MPAGFPHSRHLIMEITKCRRAFGSSARQPGHAAELGTPWLWQGCPVLRHTALGSVVCRGTGAGRFKREMSPLQPARSQGAIGTDPSESKAQHQGHGKMRERGKGL